jgi:hypothetical protein
MFFIVGFLAQHILGIVKDLFFGWKFLLTLEDVVCKYKM